MTRAKLSETDWVVLGTLRDVLAARGGWVRRGVPGWVMRQEIAEEHPSLYLMEVLPRLAKRGLAEAVDVRNPGYGLPVYLYRLLPAGAALLASREGCERLHVPPSREDPADEGTLIIPARTWQALRVLLRLRRTDPYPGDAESGWISGYRLAREEPVGVVTETMEPALRYGLAERRRVPHPTRARTLQALYRATDLAMSARVRQQRDHAVQLILPPAEPTSGTP